MPKSLEAVLGLVGSEIFKVKSSTKEGLIVQFELKAFPGSKKTKICLNREFKRVDAHITAQAEKSKANKAILKMMSKGLGVGVSSMEMLKGETNRNKLIQVSFKFSKEKDSYFYGENVVDLFGV